MRRTEEFPAKSVITNLTRAKRLVADALARVYEHGFAQGRLSEVDASAEARRKAGVVDAFVEATIRKMQEEADHG